MLLLSIKMSVTFFTIFLGIAYGYNNVEEFTVRMPGVHPSHPDEYIGFVQRLLTNKTYFIVSFDPIAEMEVVHHILLHGCKHADEGLNPKFCDGKTVLYAWARNAPKLNLPNGVGFKVGDGTGINYIYIEVHYANASNVISDSSGVKLSLTTDKLSKEAGTLLLGTGGKMRANSTEYFDVACLFTSNVKMHTFAFRTHTHTHGILVSGYKVHRGANNVDTWQLIGKKNPQLPQYFYPSEDVVVQKGDILAARCTMRNDENRDIYIGGSSMDEMCNFYIMYYTNGDNGSIHGCYSAGPPLYYWKTGLLLNLNNIPADAGKK